jgi:hypothetical protein
MSWARFSRRILIFAAFVVLTAVVIEAWARPIMGGGALIISIAAIWRCMQATQALEKKPPVAQWAPRVGTGRPNDLERLERTFGWKSYSPVDYDHMVRPRVARLLAHQLRAKKGVDLDLRPEVARTMVSDRTWALASPDESTQEKVDTAAIERVIAEIEGIA